MLALQPKIRNGAYFFDLLNSPGTTHFSSCVFNDTQKYILPNSTFSIQAVTNSWKYSKCTIGYFASKDSKPCSQAVGKEKGNGRVKWCW